MTSDRPPGSALRDGWRLAVGTLTAVPISPPSRIDRPVAAWGMTLAPLAGLIPGAVAFGVGLGGRMIGLSGWTAAALALAATVLTTRALHLDGLADTADGLSSAYERERALSIMRRGDTGPAGVTAIGLTLLIQGAAWAQLLSAPSATGGGAWLGAVAVGASVVIGRLALPLLCSSPVPSARAEGLGATVAGAVRLPAVAASLLVTGAAASLALRGSGATWAGAGTGAAGAVLMCLVTTALLARRATTRLGGITGDVLGAGVELATAAAAITLAATPLLS